MCDTYSVWYMWYVVHVVCGSCGVRCLVYGVCNCMTILPLASSEVQVSKKEYIKAIVIVYCMILKKQNI